MKYFNLKYLLLAILTISFATSCKEDIDIDSNLEYGKIDGAYGAVRNVAGGENLSSITIFGSQQATGKLFFELSKNATSETKIEFIVDAEELDKYNKENGTNYALYPADKVTFSNGGVATVASGERKTDEVTITVAATGAVNSVYAIPVSVKYQENGAYKKAVNSSYIYLIKQFGPKPDASKGTGIINVAYIEVNDESLLNMGEYVMKDTGKPFFDVVHIFAANMNINPKTKRAYLNCNENVSFVLKNAEQTIRPLQAKGIKVCLSVLGNWDESGMASLSAEAAADFAQELKNYVDLYGLDGVDFDDEWSAYNYGEPNPGFVRPSSDAYARLVYEARKAMPDKFISVYEVGNYLPTGVVEGVNVTDLYDYSYNPYYGSWWTRSHMDTTKEKFGPYPVDLSVSLPNINNVKRIRDGKYGVMVFYNYKKDRALNYEDRFNQVSNILFDQDVVWSGFTYGKKDFKGTFSRAKYEDYLGTFEMKPSGGLFWYPEGPWWDWKSSLSFQMRVDKHEDGKSYKVYGWGKSADELPFIMKYNAEKGTVSVDLPQVVQDKAGVDWTYVARFVYYYQNGTFTTQSIPNAFVGGLDPVTGRFSLTASEVPGIYPIDSMDPVKISGSGDIEDIKGGLWQDYGMQPFHFSR